MNFSFGQEIAEILQKTKNEKGPKSVSLIVI